MLMIWMDSWRKRLAFYCSLPSFMFIRSAIRNLPDQQIAEASVHLKEE